MDSKIIVACDGMNEAQALTLAERLGDKVWGFKVNDLLIQNGLPIIEKLKKHGKVFADAKLYDIPNTVANSVAALSSAGADLITVHASGGVKMMQAAVKAAGKSQILAVTVLTSMDQSTVNSVYHQDTASQVKSLAHLAAEAEVFGIVCSPEELTLLSTLRLAKVTPGVRPEWHVKGDDQVRIATPLDAVKQGASFLVVGRPITGHADPLHAVELINREVSQA